MQQRGLKTSSSTVSSLTARLIVEALLTFVPSTLLALRNATSSSASPDGLSRCNSPDGLKGESCGRGRARANRSRRQAMGGGLLDERHLWPAFFRLIRECRPAIVVGEQVASKDAEPWLDAVLADLETVDYAGAAVAFPSAGVGAPHIRDRTYWMGYADSTRLEGFGGGHQAARRHGQAPLRSVAEAGELVRLADRDCDGRETFYRSQFQGDTEHNVEPRRYLSGSGRPGPVNGFWRGADWLYGRDRKWRPVEPGSFPLADGVPNRVGRLRAYGNAINAQQGAEFMRAVMECLP